MHLLELLSLVSCFWYSHGGGAEPDLYSCCGLHLSDSWSPYVSTPPARFSPNYMDSNLGPAKW